MPSGAPGSILALSSSVRIPNLLIPVLLIFASPLALSVKSLYAEVVKEVIVQSVVESFVVPKSE